MSGPLSIIVLCDDSRSHAGTLREHLWAFKRYSKHRVSLFNTLGVTDARHLDLDAFDVVALHYSLVITADGYLSPALRERVRSFKGLKVQFLQDEYRWVDDIAAMMRHLELDVLFSIVPPGELDKVYGGRIPGIEVVPTLAGYVPEALVGQAKPPLARRPVDVGYRGRVLPYWNGTLSQEKVQIAQGVLARIGSTGLEYDIAWGENDRLYGRRWIRFLSSCRTTLGTESGTSITDFDGSIERSVREYMEEHPGATFEEVSEAVLAPHEGNVMMNVVSPRVFEAAALRTAMVLFPGHYGGTVEPEQHYIPLAKDFSNFDEVVDAIRDVPALEQMVERTYEDVIGSGRYSLATFVHAFDEVVERRASVRGSGRTSRLLLARAERPFTAGTIAGYDPRARVRRLTQWYATAGLIAVDSALRQILLAWLRDPRTRSRVRLVRLAEDLLRLGMARRAQAREPGLLEPFWVSARRDAARGALVLVSHPDDELAPERQTPAQPGLADVDVLLWDHRAVGVLAHHQLPFGRWLSVPVGYYGVIGIHHFGALGVLLRDHARVVGIGFEPLLQPPRAREPQQLRRLRRAGVRRLPARFTWLPVHPGRRHTKRPAGIGALIAGPRAYVAKAGVLTRLLVSDRRMRRLYLAARNDRTLRPAIAATQLLEDILKLHAVEQARSGRITNVARVDVLQADGELTFVTRREGIDYRSSWPALDRTQPLRRIAWDNRDLGNRLAYPTKLSPRLELAAGLDGIHRFHALEQLAERHPDEVWDALAADSSERPALRRLATAPRNYVAKGAILVQILVSEQELRTLVRAALPFLAKREIPAASLLGDVLKLHVLREAAAGRIREVKAVALERTDGVTTFRTTTDIIEGQPGMPAQRTRSLVWDNSAAGQRVSLSTPAGVVQVWLGPEGVWAYPSLERVLPRLPEAVLDALIRIEPAGARPPLQSDR